MQLRLQSDLNIKHCLVELFQHVRFIAQLDCLEYRQYNFLIRRNIDTVFKICESGVFHTSQKESVFKRRT